MQGKYVLLAMCFRVFYLGCSSSHSKFCLYDVTALEERNVLHGFAVDACDRETEFENALWVGILYLAVEIVEAVLLLIEECRGVKP